MLLYISWVISPSNYNTGYNNLKCKLSHNDTNYYHINDSLALILLQSTGIVPQGSLQRTQIKICITFQCHMTKLSLKSIQKIRISSCASREKFVSTPVHHARNPYKPLCITRAAPLGPRGRDRRARRCFSFVSTLQDVCLRSIIKVKTTYQARHICSRK